MSAVQLLVIIGVTLIGTGLFGHWLDVRERNRHASRERKEPIEQ